MNSNDQSVHYNYPQGFPLEKIVKKEFGKKYTLLDLAIDKSAFNAVKYLVGKGARINVEAINRLLNEASKQTVKPKTLKITNYLLPKLKVNKETLGSVLIYLTIHGSKTLISTINLKNFTLKTQIGDDKNATLESLLTQFSKAPVEELKKMGKIKQTITNNISWIKQQLG